MTEFQAEKSLASRWFCYYFNPYELHEHALKASSTVGIQAFQLIVAYGFIYHEALIHLALILHPQRGAIVGDGKRVSLRGVLRHKTVEKSATAL